LETNPRTFQSKADPWLVVPLLFSASTSTLAGAVTILFLSGRWRWVPALVLWAGAACVVWTLRSTRYILEDHHLRVLSGPYRLLVPFREIRSITPTRSPLGSPALSLDRLRIDYADRAVTISPLAQEEFIAALTDRRANS
jgi:PH (Pleckstrin Homology) domain-containing protein